MEWFVGLAGLWVFFQWILPIAILVIVGFAVAAWARRRNQREATFQSAVPEKRHERERYWPLGPEATSDEDADIHVPRK